MLRYEAQLKHKARQLRKNMTESERVLWSRLRDNQLLGVQFYRQKPIGKYIVDFYGPRTKLVVEVDGSQHIETEHAEKDKYRDEYLAAVGLGYCASIAGKYWKKLMQWWRQSIMRLRSG